MDWYKTMGLPKPEQVPDNFTARIYKCPTCGATGDGSKFSATDKAELLSGKWIVKLDHSKAAGGCGRKWKEPKTEHIEQNSRWL